MRHGAYQSRISHHANSRAISLALLRAILRDLSEGQVIQALRDRSANACGVERGAPDAGAASNIPG